MAVAVAGAGADICAGTLPEPAVLRVANRAIAACVAPGARTFLGPALPLPLNTAAAGEEDGLKGGAWTGGEG